MKKQLKQLLFFNSFFVFAGNMFAPLYALYIEEIETAVYHIGGIWSFYILSTGVLVFFISKLEDKKCRAPYFLIASFLLRGLGWFFFIFVSSLWQLYAIQLILALGESFGTPTYNLMYSSYLTKGHFASDWGLDKSLSSFVIAAASFVGSIVVYNFGFNTLFAIMVLLSIISSVLVFIYKEDFRDARFFVFR